MGFGPRTGRGAGLCRDDIREYIDRPYAASGRWTTYPRSGGRGRGWRHEYFATHLPRWARCEYIPLSQEQELSWLKDEAEWFKSQFEQINQRIEELEQNE